MVRSASTIPASGSPGLLGGAQPQKGSEWGWLCCRGGWGKVSRSWPRGFWFGGTGMERCQALHRALALGFPSWRFWLLSVQAGMAQGSWVLSPAMHFKVPLGRGTNWDFFPPLCSIPSCKSSQTPSLGSICSVPISTMGSPG